jgi:hypothetical protein
MFLQPCREASDAAVVSHIFWYVQLSRTSTENLLDDSIRDFRRWQDVRLRCNKRRLPVLYKRRLSPHGVHDGGLNAAAVRAVSVLEFLVEAFELEGVSLQYKRQ